MSSPWRRTVLYASGGALLALNAAALYFQLERSFDALILVALLEGAVYLAAASAAGRSESRGRPVVFILAVATLLRLGPLLLPPYLSTDIYRYIWDGRVQEAGINPYRYIPSDPALASLRDDAIYPNINRAGYARTIYPPAAQMIFLAVASVSQRVTAMKLAMLGFDAATILFLLMLMRRMGAPPERILIYAWSPLTIWEIAGSGHIDAALCFALTLALFARQRDRPFLSGIALGLGTLIKLFPASLAPSLYRRWDWRFPAAFAAVTAALYLPYLSAGWHVLGFLPDYVAEERFAGGSGFYLASLIQYLLGLTEPPVAAYLTAVVGVFLGCSLVILFGVWPGEGRFAVGALLLALLSFLAVSPHHSWYFLWILPLLCLVPYWPGLLLAAASFILYATLGLAPPARGLLVNTLLYGPFLLAAAIHLCLHRFRPSAAAGDRSESA